MVKVDFQPYCFLRYFSYFYPMKQTFFLFLLFGGIMPASYSQSSALFNDTKVAEIFVSMPPDSFNYMYNNAIHDHYLKADFVFDDGTVSDVVPEIGIRLRGNTSLAAQKKSFKISFNEYDPDIKYQEVRKLNLIGEHNDPTMVRERLFYKVWEKAGMPFRKTAFVRLYINGVYYGLYTNAEEIDKLWLKREFGNNDGNLYKCTYPANLAYINDNELSYKSIMNNPESRAYDLVTNESADDYSRLVALIKAINKPADANYPGQIAQILNVESVLKSFAIDVATGNWDDYFYNKNNYYLYDNPATGRFEFITYDTDNTFGVDWVNKDWAFRNCLFWQNTTDSRPLAFKLMAVPAYKDQFVRYLDTISRSVTLPDSIFPFIDYMHNQITSAANQDIYRTYDYGYTMDDFHNGFIQTVDGHTPYGIKPFLEVRGANTLSQIAGLIATDELENKEPFTVSIFPNPSSDGWMVTTDHLLDGIKVVARVRDPLGRVCYTATWTANTTPHQLFTSPLPAGIYALELEANGQLVRKAVGIN